MRRLCSILTAVFLAASPAFAQSNSDASFAYRGFVVDISFVPQTADLTAVESSVKHQLDIVADCGAKNTILNFFRQQEIILKPGIAEEGRSYSNGTLVIDAAPQPAEQPVILHELLHVFQARALPGGNSNGAITMFYEHAKNAQLYPHDAYLLTNPLEFFAVTGSLYLWGHVDRPPYSRESLKAKQPYYYAWLGQLFGVRK